MDITRSEDLSILQKNYLWRLKMVDIQMLLSRLDRVKALRAKKHAESYVALCPAHNDKRPSLCVDLTHDSRILLYCRSGCGAVDVLASIGLEMPDLFPNSDYKRPPGYKPSEIYHALNVAVVAKHSKPEALHGINDLKTIEQALKVLHHTKNILRGQQPCR
jgi:CHC2-type zinc finger protein